MTSLSQTDSSIVCLQRSVVDAGPLANAHLYSFCSIRILTPLALFSENSTEFSFSWHQCGLVVEITEPSRPRAHAWTRPLWKPRFFRGILPSKISLLNPLLFLFLDHSRTSFHSSGRKQSCDEMTENQATSHLVASIRKRKTQRASFVCKVCQKRKIRCDLSFRTPPCTNCRLDQTECSLPEYRRRR